MWAPLCWRSQVPWYGSTQRSSHHTQAPREEAPILSLCSVHATLLNLWGGCAQFTCPGRPRPHRLSVLGLISWCVCEALGAWVDLGPVLAVSSLRCQWGVWWNADRVAATPEREFSSGMGMDLPVCVWSVCSRSERGFPWICAAMNFRAWLGSLLVHRFKRTLLALPYADIPLNCECNRDLFWDGSKFSHSVGSWCLTDYTSMWYTHYRHPNLIRVQHLLYYIFLDMMIFLHRVSIKRSKSCKICFVTPSSPILFTQFFLFLGVYSCLMS